MARDRQRPIKYERPPMYPKQAAFVDCTAKYTLCEASTKCGKTVGCLVWIVEQALNGKEGQNFWWIAPTYSVAAIAYTRLKAWLRQAGIPDTIWKANENDQAVTLAGRKIWFKGGDKPDVLYGEDVFAAVIDEGCRVKEQAWYAVRSTLTATNGPVKIIGNVRGRKNWAYKLARRAEGGEQNTAYFRLTAYDAADGGIFDMAEIEDAKRMLPADVFKELYLAEASEGGGNPFGLDKIEECTKPGLDVGPAAYFGVDLAKSVDYTVVCGINQDRGVCTLERWRSDWGQTAERVAGIIRNTPTQIDATGVGAPVVEAIHKKCPLAVGFNFTSASRQPLMGLLASAIHRGEVFFPEGWLVDELDSFEYQYTGVNNDTVKYACPDGLHDDGVMALALALQARQDALSRVVKIDPIPLPTSIW